MTRPINRKTHAFRVFFPAAALYATLAVPLSVFAMTSGHAWPPGLIGGGHGRELLFGFALALVAGYTLGPVNRRMLAGLLALWLGARLIQPFFPGHPLAEALNAVFVAWLAVLVVPRFLAAKKWRNRILSPLLLALCLLPVGYAVALYTGGYTAAYTLRIEAVILLGLLMAFIGGRIIAPAAAGESEKRGLTLEARVQPRIETMIILSLVAAAVTLPVEHLSTVTGIACLTGGGAVWLRLARWRPRRYMHRPDLIGLCIGYAWLGTGLLALGWAIIAETAVSATMHIITVGALGGLSTGVMARLHNQHVYRRAPPSRVVIPAVALVSAATVFRFVAGTMPFETPWALWAAALSWSGAYLLLAGHLLNGNNKQTDKP